MDAPASQTRDTPGPSEGRLGEAVDETDRLFETLANRRRRETLRYLRSHSEGAVVIRDLSEHVAAWENGIDPVSVTYKQRKRVYTALYQSHLPKLHEHGFVEYDADRGTVRLAPRAQACSAYLDSSGADRPPWSGMYLSITLAAWVLVSVERLGVIPSATAWSALVACIAVFTALSVGYAVQTR